MIYLSNNLMFNNLLCCRFTDGQSIAAIRSKALALPHIRGGTRTDRALELAAEDFFGWEDSGDRPNKPNVLIVLTDGDTNEGSKPFSQVIPPLDVSKITVNCRVNCSCCYNYFLRNFDLFRSRVINKYPSIMLQLKPRRKK